MLINTKTEKIVTIHLSANELDSLKRNAVLSAPISIPQSCMEIIRNATQIQFK